MPIRWVICSGMEEHQSLIKARIRVPADGRRDQDVLGVYTGGASKGFSMTRYPVATAAADVVLFLDQRAFLSYIYKVQPCGLFDI